MANWIIPCNPKYFDVFGAYGKLKSIDWNQSAKSIDVGDNVYIYVGKPVQAIMFKTRVVATGITAEEVDYSDQEFDLEANQGSMEPDREKRWMRLELIKSYSNRDLSFNKLVQYGLKGNIQGPRRTDEDIQGLIDMVDPPTEESIQLTNAPGAREEKDQENRKDKNKDYEVNTETGSYSKLIDAELKNMSYQTLSARFREWLERSGFKAVSIPTIISDCFYLWRKKSPEQFWLAVEGDEKTSYAMLHQALAENSSANPDNVIRGYVLQIGRFRQFANSWSGREMHSNQKAGQRITENRQHQVEPVFPVNGSASINAGKDNRRIEKKLDSLISVISAMSSKKGISEEIGRASCRERV